MTDPQDPKPEEQQEEPAAQETPEPPTAPLPPAAPTGAWRERMSSKGARFGTAAAALVLVAGTTGFALGHATAGDDHGPRGFPPGGVRFEQGPPGSEYGWPPEERRDS